MVKDLKYFEFDKELYLDLFLNKNKEKAKLHEGEINKMKNDLVTLKEAY